MSTKTPLLIIAGPTATGKSAAAAELALRMDGEVISADSVQVYRGMDIGSAKVTEEEMRGVPHHLIDCADPSETWNVVRFKELAKRAAEDIAARGRLPILCGGTGFYIQALLYNIDFTQMDENTPLRKELADLAREQGPEALHALLMKADPDSAAQIHPNNVKRVIRAIEFAHESGHSISAHNLEQHARESAYRSVYFVLNMERRKLYERIDRRVDIMMDEGLEKEARYLYSLPIDRKTTCCQAIGYKEFLPLIDNEPGSTIERVAYEIKLNTRHFAKRQLTWFRYIDNIIKIDRNLNPKDQASFILESLNK